MAIGVRGLAETGHPAGPYNAKLTSVLILRLIRRAGRAHPAANYLALPLGELSSAARLRGQSLPMTRAVSAKLTEGENSKRDG